MTSRDFCFWLQGYLELAPDLAAIDPQAKQKIRNHLAMVFKHEIDPSSGPVKHQFDLSQIHEGPLPEGTLLRC